MSEVKRKTSRRAETVKKNTPKVEKSLVKVNEDPIRKKYISGFKKTKKEIDKFKKEWEEFEKEDQPAFSQWYNHNFATKLTEKRDLEQKAHELRSFLGEIDEVKYQKKISYYKAYLFVKERRANPQMDDRKENYSGKDYDKVDEEYEKDPEDLDEEELAEIFEDVIASNPMLREMLRRDKRAYKIFFEKFKEDFYSQQPTSSNDKGKKDANTSEDELIKAKYRVLVRKLHPDFIKENDDRSKELWYEVQKAYAEKDLERLDMLMALSDIHTGNSDGTTSIAQLMAVIIEYKEQLKALKKRIKLSKQDIAWNFTKRDNKEVLKKGIEKELLKNTIELKMDIDHFEKLLKSWSKPPSKARG